MKNLLGFILCGAVGASIPEAVKFAGSANSQHAWLVHDGCYIGANIQKVLDGNSAYISLESSDGNTRGYPEVAIVADHDGKSWLQVNTPDGLERIEFARIIRAVRRLDEKE